MDQINLSERLQLLHELCYSDFSMPNHTVGFHSKKKSRDVRLLDTIAVALTTGKPGEVFAAAFDKRGQIQLVLAKNGLPTSEDIAAANELISLIGSPTVRNAIDLFPFLIRRCGANIDKGIRRLHTCIQGTELRNDFVLALQSYAAEANMQAELPGTDRLLRHYGDTLPPFATVWGDFVEKLTISTAHGLNKEGVPAFTSEYAELFLFADTLKRSRFLNMLIDDRNPLNQDRKERAEKLKRRLSKVCQYVSGVSNLILKAKRLFPIPHRWVTDTFVGTGEGSFDLCDSVHDAISRELDQPCSSTTIMDKLDKHFPSILDNWAKQQTVHACVHAELRIILHLGLPSSQDSHLIGVSKRSCYCCMLWIESHNLSFGTKWTTSGSHDKPYANWVLPGADALEADGTSSVDEAVLDAVSVRLTDALDWLFPGQKKISDDHVSSGESSDDDERPSKWRLHVHTLAGL